MRELSPIKLFCAIEISNSAKARGDGTTTIDFPEAERRMVFHDAVGGTFEQVFNQAGDLVQEIRPDATTVSYAYDGNGNLEYYTNSRGNRTRYLYNDAQQLSEIRRYQTATATTPVRTILMARNLRGDLMGYTDGGVSMTYTRDILGRVLTASTNYGPFTKQHSLTYTTNGQRNTYTAVDGTTFTYLWDAANQFGGVLIPNEGGISVNYEPRSFDLPTRIQYPGGTKQTFDYNDLLRVDEIESKDAAQQTLLRKQYSYEVGPHYGALITGISTEHGDYTYDYDDAFRLTSAQYPNAPSESFTYDQIGRRQPGTGAPWTYTAQGAVLSTGAATYTYDVDGNRRTKTEGGITTTYVYDEANKLIQVERPTGTVVSRYGYDPFGRRLWKEVGGVRTYFYYDEDGLAGELDSTGAVTKTYLFPPEGLFSTAPLAGKSSGAYEYFHNDHLGTPWKTTNNVGAVQWSATYRAYGEATSTPSGAAGNRLRFPGQYADAETGLNYNFHRYYDPALGAYQEEDPVGRGALNRHKKALLVAFIPSRQAVHRLGNFELLWPNRHQYVGSNPMSFLDPNGLWRWPPDIWDQGAREAKESGLPGSTSGPQDAYRHCLTSCLLARENGAFVSRFLGDLNEYLGNLGDQKRNDALMDYHNNACGRRYADGAESEDDCRRRCLEGITRKELIISIEPSARYTDEWY